MKENKMTTEDYNELNKMAQMADEILTAVADLLKEQFIHIDEDGDKFYYSDREMNILHREDGPAVEYEDGYKAWYLNGLRHREDGPASSTADCYKAWYIDGKRHREDGPAVEYANGSKAWYLNDERLTEEEFNARMNPVELTLDEIAKKFGVSVDKLKIKKG